MTAPNQNAVRAGEWRRRLLVTVSALLGFETLTGLAVYLFPFSVSNQVMVLVHTAAGLVLVPPFAWYQVRHWQLYRRLRPTHVMLTGYFALAATITLLVSGLVLTWQALFGIRISRGWDLCHVVATFALIASVLPHVLAPAVRAVRARSTAAGSAILSGVRRFGYATGFLTVGLFSLVALAVATYRPVPMINEFPADYSLVFGPDRPFAPSLARTSTGGALDARSLAGSKDCGTSGCHREIYEEWQVSAHRYAAMDPAFQKVQSVMAEQNGPESTRYCGGCHDPISLFSGAKTLFSPKLSSQAGYQEGVSCIVCHAIKETDVKGNAQYLITQPGRYLFELSEAPLERRVRDFLIRSYPRYHIQSLQHKLFKSPEFCAACHKQFIDEEINQVGWVQLQNQYDNWRKSRWNHPGDAGRTIECRECHMPLQDSRDPGAGDDRDYNRTPGDRRHRSHRFLGANQFMPVLLKLPGAAEHVALTEKWLRGQLAVPEIADKWRPGPAVPIELVVPDTVRPGDPVAIQAVITNNKVGHDFPTGPLDIIQSWVELVVTTGDGRVVFRTGERDGKHFIAPGSFIFKAEPVDQYGNLIDRHNLWEMVGVRFRRAVFPGFSDRADFAFPAPRATELRVSARLMYRKIDQFLLNFLFGKDAGITAPVTAVSEDHRTIVVAAHR